jgi:hypothetical protein
MKQHFIASMRVLKGQESRYNLPSVCNKLIELGLGTADLMGLSMCDDRYLAFEWVSVLRLTFVIKARSGLRNAF